MATQDGGLLNAVGLSNPGARVFAEELSDVRGRHLPIIVSIFGGGPIEFSRVVDILDSQEFLAYELNLSCPHVEGVGTEIGHDPEVVASVVKAVRSRTKKPIFAKLSPNTHKIVEIAKAAVDSGADGLTAVNTMRAMAINVETTKPTLSHKYGGLSGRRHQVDSPRQDIRAVREVKVPIIGCGGVSTWEHAVELMLAGASGSRDRHGPLPGVRSLPRCQPGSAQYMRKKKFRKVQEMVGLGH